ncbi:hypothetical protein BO86DRAFT_384439 [Aspergillus japonicus CBS 114.51]|uniref:Uncharacterized protein n=1 Tax=Aspergillus japonicus CBS 114.51 TaxID=1448312 RepID=A0A8T8XIF1_ASPJA|nr:hypothetical protein BO86DRAFT_384439 [Aspergillus japonicus CBS 114.51]RAH87242.1 hypothetical protein BO86DRAFT_384439 [Aspergillus japonicus CBS 114.51]
MPYCGKVILSILFFFLPLAPLREVVREIPGIIILTKVPPFPKLSRKTMAGFMTEFTNPAHTNKVTNNWNKELITAFGQSFH